ncbi:carbohydrate kinase family protein [Neobacillus pocheonensis]|uniref:carbohydrate kinase family protein n=1 Tax=Neobacillus pocheonensis TaxID=363869 RepID=UPI003D2CB598
MEKYEVLVHGIVSTDVIFSSIPRIPDPGEEVYCGAFEFTCGAAYNTAVALSRLGIKVAMVSPIGNDFLSKFMKESLEAEGVSTELMKQLDYPLRTLSVALNYGGDRSFISYQDDLGDFNFEEYVSGVIRETEAKFLHTGASPDAAPIIQMAKRKGLNVSLDVGWDDQWLSDPKLKDIIQMGDLFTPNLKEALKISGETSAQEAMDVLSKINNRTIIKLGEEGALLKKDGSQRIVSGFKRTAVDTTGAGDVFVAGVLTGILKGMEIEEAVRLGNFCGGCSVEGLGGTKTSPTWERVEKEYFQCIK